VTKKSNQFSYVDLFAGCGGLSLGLETEGGTLITAVERSPMAGETFFHNLIQPVESAEGWAAYLQKDLASQAKAGLVVSELQNLLNNEKAMEYIASSEPDVVVGGPPCQGFSLAGRRRSDDSRNQLPWQFLEVVNAANPKMVIIENVVGMRHKFNSSDGDAVFDQLKQALAQTGKGYRVQTVEVNALHYGAPQHRPRLMLIGLREDLAAEKGIVPTETLWKSTFEDLAGDAPTLVPKPTAKSATARTVRDAIADLAITSSVEPCAGEYLALMKNDKAWAGHGRADKPFRNHVARRHQPHAISRFRLYQIISANNLDGRLLSRISILDDEQATVALRQAFAEVKFPLSSPDGIMKLETFDDLVAVALQSRTRKHSQRVLDWDQPSRTVVTIGDDYVHPKEPRTFTVRELARFQGFPDKFEFRAKETTGGTNRQTEVPQYSQVGNAVSPMLAIAVGRMIKEVLR
jgi:DNA (cytosine-5)-methyltransferase 1